MKYYTKAKYYLAILPYNINDCIWGIGIGRKEARKNACKNIKDWNKENETDFKSSLVKTIQCSGRLYDYLQQFTLPEDFDYNYVIKNGIAERVDYIEEKNERRNILTKNPLYLTVSEFNKMNIDKKLETIFKLVRQI